MLRAHRIDRVVDLRDHGDRIVRLRTRRSEHCAGSGRANRRARRQQGGAVDILHRMSPLREGSEEPGKRLGQLGFTSARRGAFILDSAWRALQIPVARPRLTAGHSGSHKRSAEHTSELQSLMRISYAVFLLKKNIINTQMYKTEFN